MKLSQSAPVIPRTARHFAICYVLTGRTRSRSIEELGRRTTETVTGHSAPASEPLQFDHVLTSVELEEGPPRLAKNGLSILNIPVAIQAWKGRAAELSTARRIPAEMLKILHSRAWELAEQGAGQLPSAILEEYSENPTTAEALAELDEYSRSLQARQEAWTDQLSRYDFWDACPKSALARFMATGELPCDEMPPTCGYVAEHDDIDIIITRLNHPASHKPELPSSHHRRATLLKMVLLRGQSGPCASPGLRRERSNEAVRSCDDDMLSAHIECAPIADAFAGWFDGHILNAAT